MDKVEPILYLSLSGLVFGSRRFLKKVASRDSEKSLVEETQARSPGELLPEDNKVDFLPLKHFMFCLKMTDDAFSGSRRQGSRGVE